MNYTYQDIVAKIQKCGFIKMREGKGSHELREDQDENIILLPKHGNKTLSKGVIKQIIKAMGVSNNEFHQI